MNSRFDLKYNQPKIIAGINAKNGATIKASPIAISGMNIGSITPPCLK